MSVDARTKACTHLKSARACVELDVTKTIPDSIWINLSDNRSYWQIIEVESKLAYCGKCKVHGHLYEACRKKKPAPLKASAEIKRNEVIEESQNVMASTQGHSSYIGGEKQQWRKVVSRKHAKLHHLPDEQAGSQEQCKEDDQGDGQT